MDWVNYLIITLLAISHNVYQASSLAVMSIDLGSEWMKIAIVSPGVPMEVVLNEESKRKTPVSIAFRDDERTFGDEALGVGVRFPELSYHHLLDLLGKKIDNPIVQLYKQRFPHHTIESDPTRNTVVFKHPSGKVFGPEELLAQIIYKAREYAQESAGQSVTEAVLTVPGYFNDVERRSLIKATELAGLKVLQLINDYSAVALNYGIFRKKDFAESAQYVMFYDMGASSTSATVVSFQTVKVKDKGFIETLPQASIIGVGIDRTLGGLEMTVRLQNHLAKKFNEMKKTNKNVFENPRAMAKLFKEAGRVKTVLSANVDHFAQVEGLIDGVDFRLKVTREEFEQICADLFDRVKEPVEKALKMSGLSADILNQVVLVGAGTRVPMVQERLAGAVGRDLSKNLNTDEAAVMGAVYRAADLSTGFKVSKFIVKDAVLYPIQVVFDRDVESGLKQVRRTLFGVMNPYPQKKVLTLYKHTEDFSFNVNYAELDHLTPLDVEAIGVLNLTKVNLKGVGDAIAKFASEGAEVKGIKAHFSLDDSGILSLPNVEFVAEVATVQEEESPFSKLGSTISKLFSGPEDSLKDGADIKSVPEGAEEEEKDKENKTEPTKDSTEGKDTPPSGDANKKNETTKEAEVPKKPKLVTLKRPITAEIEDLGVPLLSEEAFKTAAERIESLNRAETEKANQQKALNLLESTVFDYRQKIDDKKFADFAKEEEVEKIKASCNELSEWLDDEGFSADTETLQKKLKDFQNLLKPVLDKKKNHEQRGEAVEKLNTAINQTIVFVSTIRNMTAVTEGSPPPFYSETEMDGIDKLVSDAQKWLTESLDKQSKLTLSDVPALTTKQIFDKIQLIEAETRILVNKVKLWDQAMKAKTTQDSTKNDTSKKDKTSGKKRKKSSSKTDEETAGKEAEEDAAAGTEPEGAPEGAPKPDTDQVLNEESVKIESSPSSSDPESSKHTEL